MALNRQSVPFIIFFLLLTVLVRNNGFFWDSIVIGSGYANWYYSTGFESIFVPEEIAGYPPLFGMYIAMGWKLLGKSLNVSHALILPFLIGVVLQAQRLVNYFIQSRYTFWILLLVLLEPTFLAQATQVSPDIVLLFLYLFGLNCILKYKRIALAVAMVALALLSPRGTILVGGLFFTEIFLLSLNRKPALSVTLLFKTTLAYLPALLLTCIWLYLHYHHHGWIFYNKNSAWGQGSSFVDLRGFIKNIAVVGLRFADFGKLIPFLLLSALLLFYKNHMGADLKFKKLFIIAIVPFTTLTVVLLFYQNPIAHRYYIVVFMMALLLLGYLWQYTEGAWQKLAMYGVVGISLLAGHFVVAVYPEQVSKGWDATLAHLPYFDLRQKMLGYLHQEGIPTLEVGSAYPNLRTTEWIDLDEAGTVLFKEKNLSKHKYILHSNIFNDFTDAELDELRLNWKIKQEYSAVTVFMRLYERR